MMPRIYTHQPVLLKEILTNFDYLQSRSNFIFVDGTLGLGGHSLAIAKQYKGEDIKYRVLGIDKDKAAVKLAEQKIEEAGLSGHFTLIHDDFNNIEEVVDHLKIDKVDGILLDLGVSSMQLDDASRGFSFSDPDQTLDMRMDKTQELTASVIINNYPEKKLAEVLKTGEEWHYKKISSEIVKNRKIKKFHTVGDLLQVIAPVLKRGYSKTHFATDTFRALRLEVNGELAGLDRAIRDMIKYLKPGSRLAVVTFHSTEDRIVKDVFRQLANPCTCPPKLPSCVCCLKPEVKIISRKPILPSEEEIRSNPRARSAKLRVIEKL